MKRMGYQRLSIAQRVILGFTTVFIFSLGLYHITHQGRNSGTTELIAFVLLLLALFLPHQTRHNFRRYSALQIALIGVVDFFALYFGIYHLTTPDGLRSGIMELTTFTMLTTAIFWR